MAIYRGTGGWSNTTGTAEADAVVAAQVAVQNALTQIETDLTASESYKNQAEAAAITATNSATGIEGYATLAATKAVEASASATASANSASAAAISETNALASETTATTQAGIATTKATEAATSATNAANSATTASTQATNAVSSATSAANSATTATTQATNASNSATAAATNATNAANSATAAAASAAAAATFDPSSYYTKTNLDGGQLDNRYYTETEVNTALLDKQDTLVSGTNIKTINGTSVLGSGDIVTPTTTVNNTLTSTSTTEALSAAQGKLLQDSKQVTLVSGTNIKTVNNQSILGSGNLDISSDYYLVSKTSFNTTSITLTGFDFVNFEYNLCFRGITSASGNVTMQMELGTNSSFPTLGSPFREVRSLLVSSSNTNLTVSTVASDTYLNFSYFTPQDTSVLSSNTDCFLSHKSGSWFTIESLMNNLHDGRFVAVKGVDKSTTTPTTYNSVRVSFSGSTVSGDLLIYRVKK